MLDKSIFYQKIGRVTELAQYFELELGTLLIVSEAESKKLDASSTEGSKAYEKLIDSVNKNTLGKTLRIIQKNFMLLEEFPEIMEAALEARNRFAHHIFREFSLAINSDADRAEMLSVVEELQSSMQQAYDIVSPITDRLISEKLRQ
jgi:hypothetical protein